MEKLNVFNQRGEVVDTIPIDNYSFSSSPSNWNVSLFNRYYSGNSRQGTKKTKNKSEVSGRGGKPWRQKGTGRARSGSLRNPQFRGGGVAFGPRGNENYSLVLNKKFKKSLFKSSIDKKIGDGEMTVVDRIFFGSWKTKDAFNFVKSFDEDFSNFLLVLSCNEENKEKIIKSFRNLPFVRILEGNVVNSAQIISSKRIVVTRLAFKEILRDRLI